MIDLLTNSEEQEIADTISRMLADTYPLSRFRVPAQQRPQADARVVADLAALGATAIGIAEDKGGLGLGHGVEVLAFREAGRALVSPAMLGTVIGARLAARAGDDDLTRQLLEGEKTCGLSLATRMSDSGELSGQLQLFDVGEAQLFVHWNEDGAGLYDASVLDVRGVNGLDETLIMHLAEEAQAKPLCWAAASDDDAALSATLLGAAMMVGMGEAVRDMAVEYAKTREQYGKPIGHFQAVKHKCADMALHCEAAWCETVYAALDLDNGGAGAPFHVLNAKMLAGRALLAAAKDNIQIHGGMGYTTEVSAHHFVKRGRILNEIGGSARNVLPSLLQLPFAS